MNEETTMETVLPAEPEQAPKELAPRKGHRRWVIAMDVVTRVTAPLDEDQRESLRWLASYGASLDLTTKELAERLLKPDGTPYSSASVYAALTGRRNEAGASIENMVDAVERLKRRASETRSRTSTKFIETPLTRTIFRVCRTAFTKKRLAVVFGDSQTGKTTAINEYADRHNHGETHLIRMPIGGRIADLRMDMARHLHISEGLKPANISRRIMDCFDEKTLLIVDEAHQACGRTRSEATNPLEFIRDIYDRRGCGVVLVGTKLLRTGLQEDRILAQLWRRRSTGLVVKLPDVPPPADLAAFASAFGLDPAPDRDVRIQYTEPADGGEPVTRTYTSNPARLQATVVADQGLGSWIKLLEDAKRSAEEDGKPITWGRVIIAHCLAVAAESIL
jgi:DNA transposition AAA+ family ATPase